MASHMTLEDRHGIERRLRLGWTLAQIAKELERPESTIAREIKKRRINSDKGASETKSSICALYETCRRTKVCEVDCGMRKYCKNCIDCVSMCADFQPRECIRLVSSPFVCNGCEKERSCRLRKKFYIADGAQINYDSTLHESRRGVHATDAELSEINAVLSKCTRKGQSVRNVMANHREVFKVCERTVYNYITLRKFDIIRGDLPFACMRKPRKVRPITKTDAKCRVGRTYNDLIAYWMANGSLKGHEVEMDGLEGQQKERKYLFTFFFNDCGLLLGFMRDSKTSAECTRVFDILWEAAGPALFKKLFAIALTDNGTEFSDPVSIEKNPEFVPRGDDIGKEWKDCASPDKYRARVFYCNSKSPKQKAHVERVHADLRRILVKGVSFKSLTQDDIRLALSHVNSYTRGVLNNITPYMAFTDRYGPAGKKFLDALGIVPVDADEVTLTPQLLGEQFARHAADVILHRHGADRED